MLKYPSIIKGIYTRQEVYRDSKQLSKEDHFYSNPVSLVQYWTLIIISRFSNLREISTIAMIYRKQNSSIQVTFLLVFELIISIPIAAINAFIGRFGRRGYLRMWDICPIFKGIGIVVIIFTINRITHNTVYLTRLTMTLMHIWRRISSNNECNRVGAPHNCFDLNRPSPHNYTGAYCCAFERLKCPVNGSYNYSVIPLASLWLYRYEVLEIYDNTKPFKTIGELRVSLCTIALIIWILVALIAALGLVRIKISIFFLWCFGFCGFFISFILTILAINDTGPFEYSIEKYDITTGQFWFLIIANHVKRNVPGLIVNIGAMSPNSSLPNFDLLFTAIIGAFFYIMLGIWTKSVLRFYDHFIGITDIHCLIMQDSELLFVLLPNFLWSHYRVTIFFTLLYYVSLFCLGFSGVLLELSGMIDAIVDLNHDMYFYRWHISLTISLFCFTCSTVFFTEGSYNFEYLWLKIYDEVPELWTVFLFIFCILLVYGLNRLQGDISFTYKDKFSISFWINCWKFLPLIVITMFVNSCIRFSNAFSILPAIDLKILIIMHFVITVTLPIMGVIYYCNFKKGISLQTSCINNWGPPDPKLYKDRQHYNPEEEINYKNPAQMCRHNCLIYSSELKAEQEKLENLINYYTSIVEK